MLGAQCGYLLGSRRSCSITLGCSGMGVCFEFEKLEFYKSSVVSYDLDLLYLINIDNASMSFPNKSPRTKDAASLHQCPQCDRSYERPDHLARHLDSHRDERTFRCPTCHRGFNHVLQRHCLIHENGVPTAPQKARAIEACAPCATAKASCDNNSPCKRCQRKEIPCVPRHANGRRENTMPTPSSKTRTPRDSHRCQDNMDFIATCDQNEQIRHTPSSLEQTLYSPSSLASFPSQVPGPLHEGLEDLRGLGEFPSFFGNIMMPLDLTSNTVTIAQQPRGVFDFMDDPDFLSSGADTDLFGTEILADLDHILQYNPSPAATNSILETSNEEQRTKQRVEAFRKSLWLWIPAKNQTGFSDDGRIPLEDGDMTASISSLHKSRLESLKIRGKLSSQLRDHIFQLVLATGGSHLSVPSFPTAESLDALIKIGISKRTETDAWIHPYTLYRYDSRPELLTALVAAGCVCSAIPTIGKAGVILLEIVRVSLTQLVESDNSVLRDLQYFQASMMWLDIGVFCGYKRKMQIAESNLQPLCTALRRAGAFDRSFYSHIQPSDGSINEETLDALWLRWVRQESLIRLVYHLFEHDVEAAAAMNRPGLTSYSELTLPFPSSRNLWLAPTASAWKQLWEQNYSQALLPDLSLRDLLGDAFSLNHLPENIDKGVVNSALLHGLMSQVLLFRQQASLTDTCRNDIHAVTRLWLQSRQDNLLLSLQTAVDDMDNLPSNAVLFSEFAMMHLHVNFASVQRFAGQFGESEARREYPNLRNWSLTKEARLCVWHAGQVLRAARMVLPFQLRGFDNLAIYHAILALWVFGLLRCGETQHENVAIVSSATPGPYLNLDEAKREPIKAFINRDIGQPGLTLHSVGTDGENCTNYCPLTSPRLVLEVGRQVLKGNFPGAANHFPPLVENLHRLLGDLANLP
ncbi:C2H2-type zinc finger protein [Aspergillus stella-maris]|uniref:C2H2-type zinc finger protein n=1 Tax=Aspergillus stella-maris TaxID=1810926 RepID=UPI003CCE1236